MGLDKQHTLSAAHTPGPWKAAAIALKYTFECPERWELTRAMTYATDLPSAHSETRLYKAIVACGPHVHSWLSMRPGREFDAALAEAGVQS